MAETTTEELAKILWDSRKRAFGYSTLAPLAEMRPDVQAQYRKFAGDVAGRVGLARLTELQAEVERLRGRQDGGVLVDVLAGSVLLGADDAIGMLRALVPELVELRELTAEQAAQVHTGLDKQAAELDGLRAELAEIRQHDETSGWVLYDVIRRHRGDQLDEHEAVQEIERRLVKPLVARALKAKAKANRGRRPNAAVSHAVAQRDAVAQAAEKEWEKHGEEIAEFERVIAELTTERDQARADLSAAQGTVRRVEGERDQARAKADRHFQALLQAFPRHFTPNVLGERLCGCDGQWLCREHVRLIEQVERVRAVIEHYIARTRDVSDHPDRHADAEVLAPMFGEVVARLSDALGHPTTTSRTQSDLQYEQRLLVAARTALDLIATGGLRGWVRARPVAADLSQRITDEIGRPATDEPPIGPSYRARFTQLTERVEWARRELDAALLTTDKMLVQRDSIAAAGHRERAAGIEVGADEIRRVVRRIRGVLAGPGEDPEGSAPW